MIASSAPISPLQLARLNNSQEHISKQVITDQRSQQPSKHQRGTNSTNPKSLNNTARGVLFSEMQAFADRPNQVQTSSMGGASNHFDVQPVMGEHSAQNNLRRNHQRQSMVDTGSILRAAS